MSKKNISRKFVLFAVALLIAGSGVVVALARDRYYKNLVFKVGVDMSKASAPSSLPTTQLSQEDVIKRRVKELMVIDDQSAPILLKIKNVLELKKQQPELYGQAQDGDVLVIYPSLVIIYSPQSDKIIASIRS